jgi:hypothetical protein
MGMCSVFKTERLGFMAGVTGAGKDNHAGEYLKTLLPTRPITRRLKFHLFVVTRLAP